MILPPLLALVLVLIQMALKKFICTKEPRKISETPGKHIYMWGIGLLCLTALFTYFFVLDTTNQNTVSWFWLILFSASMGFHSFMEWRYLKGSKEYIVTLILFAIGFPIYILALAGSL